MARYVDVDKLKEILDEEALIMTENKLVKYYDRTIALHLMDVLSGEVNADAMLCVDCKQGIDDLLEGKTKKVDLCHKCAEVFRSFFLKQ